MTPAVNANVTSTNAITSVALMTSLYRLILRAFCSLAPIPAPNIPFRDFRAFRGESRP